MPVVSTIKFRLVGQGAQLPLAYDKPLEHQTGRLLTMAHHASSQT